MKRKCIISGVGKDSFHKSWTCSCMKDIDLHLLVYDNSYERYRNDTKYIAQAKGQKFRLIHEYLSKQKKFMTRYEYFFFPDDDIFIDDVNINKLFGYMETYELELAQPALTNSYHTFTATLKQPGTILRYTNFVEMMQPCFSREALKKCFNTFNINKSGWGMDFHWGTIIDSNNKKVAIIDDVTSVHTRPARLTPEQRQENNKELEEYLVKFKITPQILEYGKVMKNNQ